MYQVNILDSNYYPVRQVLVTTSLGSARNKKNRLTKKGKLVGIMFID